MFRINFTGAFILFCVFSVLFPQQIFENYPTCEYFLDQNFAGSEDERLELQNKLWEVTGTGSFSNWKIIISPCGTPIPPKMGCGPDAAACLINSRTPGASVLNAGKSFIYTTNEEDENILQAVNGQRCGRKNYTVTVNFECSKTTKSTPSILHIEDCQLRIGMMNPSCTPACTVHENGNLIDLRPFQKLPNFLIQEPVTRKSFRLSLCKPSRECGAGISACELLNDGSKQAIADVNSQRITYDRDTNSLVIKGHFGTTKRVRKNTEIHITCNWNVEGIADLKYVTPMTQGRNFKFKAESSLACIKLPMNCLLVDIKDSNFVYNLTSLNKENGWKVGNIGSGDIYINVCGSLKFSSRSNSCSDRYAQVCRVDGGNQYASLGSIPVNCHVDGDKVKGTFVDGSICALNQSYSYSTQIEFVCAQVEKGPVLEAVNECVYKIKWETPAICPELMVKGDNCVLSDMTGITDLNDIHTTSDRTYTLTETSYLRYNLCGPLNRPCNQNLEASVCYFKNGQEHVVGLSSKTLTRSKTFLRLNLVGDVCGTGTKSKTQIYFHCNHSAPTDGAITANVAKDDCLFEMNVDTPLACTQASTTECKFYNNNSVFDLSPLSLVNNNHIVRDSSSGVNYIINICRSVVNGEDNLCPVNSGACLYNLTEPHLKYKYMSMGRINGRSTITENGNLVVYYDHGSSCPGNELFHSTTIKFQCSGFEGEPQLVHKGACSHEFIWHTPHACGRAILSLKTRSTNSVCKYIHPDTGKQVDFSNINKSLNISTADDNIFIFSLCENNYTHCTTTSKDTECKTLKSTVKLEIDQDGLYLAYLLENACLTADHANRLHIHLLCDPLQNNEHFNLTGIKDCIIHINLLTNLACTSKETRINLIEAKKFAVINQATNEYNEIVNYPEVIVQSNNLNEVKNKLNLSKDSNDDIITLHKIEENLQFIPKSIKHNCSIKTRNFELDLKDIKPINVVSSMGNNYTVNLNEPSSTCHGYICKNGPLVISDADECPVVQFNHTDSVIKLLYNDFKTCDTGRQHSEIWLKCTTTGELPKITMESKCKVNIMYPSNDVCLLLAMPKIDSSNTGIAVGSSIGLLIVAAASIGGYLVIRKRSPNMCSRSCYQKIPEDKENVKVYIKDSKL